MQRPPWQKRSQEDEGQPLGGRQAGSKGLEIGHNKKSESPERVKRAQADGQNKKNSDHTA